MIHFYFKVLEFHFLVLLFIKVLSLSRFKKLMAGTDIFQFLSIKYHLGFIYFKLYKVEFSIIIKIAYLML